MVVVSSPSLPPHFLRDFLSGNRIFHDMLIWTLAVVLFALFAVAGFFQGAIRALMLWAGVLLGALLAGPLYSATKPLVPLIGLKHPVWEWLMPPVIVFVLVVLIFFGISFFVHQKIVAFYQHRTDDYQQARWTRLNKRIGVVVGLFTGATLVFLLGMAIYVLGHLTVQVSAAESDPAYMRFLNSAREDLKETGLERAVAEFSPVEEEYYKIADILGLIYHNPAIHNRLSNYPPYIPLSDHAAFQAIAADTDLMGKLQAQASGSELIIQPGIQSILEDKALLAELQSVDLDDLHEYLKTGKSLEFDELKILGRWEIDSDALVTHYRKSNPNISASELTVVRRLAGLLSGAIRLTAKVDGTLDFKFAPPANLVAAETGVQPQAAVPAPDPNDRYGAAIPRPVQPPVQVQPQISGPRPGASFRFSGTGTWEKVLETYRIKIKDERGRERVLAAEVIGPDELIVTQGPDTIVFLRSE